jgi:TFIIF-interacting CTD phosphatase-like protein
MTKKLLVLDLDETLIHATEEPLDHPAELRFGRCHVYLRPYLADFIAGVQAHFHLALWTAGGELYARQIADHNPIVDCPYARGNGYAGELPFMFYSEGGQGGG